MTLTPIIRAKATGSRILGVGAGNRGPSPAFSGRREGRRAPGPSGAVESSHSSIRATRLSRTPHRQFQDPSFRKLVADEGNQPPLLRRPLAGNAASLKSRNQYRPDYGPRRGSPTGPDAPWFLKQRRSNSGKSDLRDLRRSGKVGRVRSLGPDTPAPTRGEAGAASSLGLKWEWGPPKRRISSGIPDLIEINSRGGPPKSAATDFPGNSRAGGRRVQLPGEVPAEWTPQLETDR